MVFDVDSTLIQDEVIELLADQAGSRAQVGEVTERAMAGELDFAGSLIARVETLAGLAESALDAAFAAIRVTPGAQELIDAIHGAGGKVGAVSGGFNQLLDPLAKQLGLDFARANQLEIVDGKFTGRVVGEIIDRQAKASALREWAAECGLELSKTIAVGDGANDLAMMDEAGLSIAFNAKPIVRENANLVIAEQNLAQLIPVLGL